MLGLLLIYFIGKRFYDLATEFNQNKWLFAILSILIYYGATAIFGIILGLLIFVFDWQIDLDNNIGIGLLALPVGLLAVWGFYEYLKSRWKKKIVLVKDEIDDIGKKNDTL
ncbi:hypothetical protein KO566_06585 [Flavobacteriaceae bacterium XHP0103]|uniref:hypothetical protein n=1 Tax=Marixanthotalea marina TaxID=2844359 RepID=UPI002989D5B6|nr:hypothetical protein [Marixanthotalea marina]MBU3821721.1 hypothetical protein [Marixanthotalea marina]